MNALTPPQAVVDIISRGTYTIVPQSAPIHVITATESGINSSGQGVVAERMGDTIRSIIADLTVVTGTRAEIANGIIITPPIPFEHMFQDTTGRAPTVTTSNFFAPSSSTRCCGKTANCCLSPIEALLALPTKMLNTVTSWILNK